MTQQDCIFCKISRGDIPAEKLFDDGTAFAINDLNPKAPTHILVIPHAHVEALTQADDDQRSAAAHCAAVAPRIAEAAGVTTRGYRLIINQGPESGQEVSHFHLHILGGRALGAMG